MMRYFLNLTFFSQIDEIVKDIRDRQDNAKAIEFTKCIGELLRKNGVVPKLTEYTRNFETDNSFETRYGVSIDELDFSEHDKIFEDKIAELENIINHKLGGWDKHGITYQEILDMKTENDKLKQKISDLESLMQKQDEFLEMKNIQIAELKKDFKAASGLLSDYRQENESLKQRIAELESKETSELPFDPLDTANYLINATYERETNSLERVFAKVPDKVNSDRYTVDDLEQIAEHLLVYCKHKKVGEE